MVAPTVPNPIDTSPPGFDRNNRPLELDGGDGKQPRYRGDKLVKWMVLAVLLLPAVLIGVPALLQQWLWMRQVNYGGIFWTLLSVK